MVNEQAQDTVNKNRESYFTGWLEVTAAILSVPQREHTGDPYLWKGWRMFNTETEKPSQKPWSKEI